MFALMSTRRLPRAAVVCAVCLALLCGVAWAHGHRVFVPWWPWALAPVALWATRRQTVLRVALLAMCCFAFGALRGAHVAQQLQLYRQFALRQVTLVGQAADDGVYDDRSQLSFSLNSVQVVAPCRAALPGTITVAGFGEQALYRGDTVQVRGKLYPTRGNAQASISFAEVHVLRRSTSGVNRLRQRFVAGLESALPEPLASFGLGLLIGQRSTLPADVTQTLLMVGLTHIIAVSGYNLTIMVEAARRLCGKRSKFQTAAACGLLIASFMLVAGTSPSLVRAAIISLLSLSCWYYGRQIAPLSLLLVAAAASGLMHPLYVWGNVSWYLSFLAFAGVLLLAPLVTRRIYGERRPALVVQILIESLCAEVLTLPYVLHVFGQLSLATLPANALVVALVPLAMLLCLVAGLAGMVAPQVSGWLAWPARLLLHYMLDVASVLARLPHVFVQHVGFGSGALLGLYAITGLLAYVLRRRVRAPKPGINREDAV